MSPCTNDPEAGHLIYYDNGQMRRARIFVTLILFFSFRKPLISNSQIPISWRRIKWVKSARSSESKMILWPQVWYLRQQGRLSYRCQSHRPGTGDLMAESFTIILTRSKAILFRDWVGKISKKVAFLDSRFSQKSLAEISYSRTAGLSTQAYRECSENSKVKPEWRLRTRQR